MKARLKNNKTLVGIVFLGLVALFLPITLLLLRDATNLASRAAPPNQLEAEDGILSDSGVSKQSDSNASGGQFVRFNRSQTVSPTNPPQVNYDDYPVPSNIDATGTTDVSVELNNWIQTIPDGTSTKHSRILFPENAIYKMSQGIRLTGSHKTLDGRGTKIVAPSGSADGTDSIAIQNSSNILVGMRWPNLGSTQTNDIVIHDFILEGDNPIPGTWDTAEGAGQQNVFVGLVDGLEVYNVTASKARGDYFYLSGYGNSNIHIHDFNGINTGRNGVSLLNTTDVLVENSAFGICAYFWVDFEPDNSLGGERISERITIRNNTFERWDPTPETKDTVGGGWIAISNSKEFTSTKDITIEGNKITGSNHATMQIYINQNSSNILTNIKIINNTSNMWLPRTITNNQRNFVFQARNIDGLTITGNHQPGAGQSNGGYWFDPTFGSTTQPATSTNVVFENNTN